MYLRVAITHSNLSFIIPYPNTLNVHLKNLSKMRLTFFLQKMDYVQYYFKNIGIPLNGINILVDGTRGLQLNCMKKWTHGARGLQLNCIKKNGHTAQEHGATI